MKNDYRIRAMRFIEQVYPYIENCDNDPFTCRRAIMRFNATRSRRVIVAHGVSRIALITSDYVIKFDYDSEEVERVGGNESEEKFYAFAKKYGFSHLFAETTSYAYGNKIFYIMPRINNIGKYESDVYWFLNTEDRDFVRDYLYDMHNFNYGWKDGYPVIIDYACNKLTCS